MMFSDYKEIINDDGKKLLLELVDYGINNVKSENLIKKFVKFRNEKLIVKGKEFDLKNKRIFVIGAGKMSGEMAAEIEKIIGSNRITYGFVNTNYIKNKTKKIIINKAEHPIPSLNGLRGTKKILEIKNKFKLNKSDIIIALISGGGSSLLPYPIDKISFNDKKKTVLELIKCGANVHEITVIKKKISKVKGGKLAEYFYPIPIISLVVSDVIGNDPSIIASGPLTKDNSTFIDALEIIEKYNLMEKIPKSVLNYIKLNQSLSEKQSFNHVKQFLLCDNNSLLDTIVNRAKNLNLKTVKIKNVQGESREVAKRICNKLESIQIKPPLLILYGGETTVTLNKRFGKGGRNQEFILSCLKYFNHKKFNNFAIASIASDGMDYIKESCGAIINKSSFGLIKQKEIDDCLDSHNSYYLLKKIGSNLKANNLTGVNVGDMMLFLFL